MTWASPYINWAFRCDNPTRFRLPALRDIPLEFDEAPWRDLVFAVRDGCPSLSERELANALVTREGVNKKDALVQIKKLSEGDLRADPERIRALAYLASLWFIRPDPPLPPCDWTPVEAWTRGPLANRVSSK